MKVKVITATITHKCICGKVIEPKEKYSRVVTFPGDEFNYGAVPETTKMCKRCLNIKENV